MWPAVSMATIFKIAATVYLLLDKHTKSSQKLC